MRATESLHTVTALFTAEGDQVMVQELFRAGQLEDAIHAATAEVKKRPTDVDARHTLFVLLCFDGEIERAEKQLDVIANQDGETRTGSVIYQSLLASEWERRKVFEENGLPTLPPDAPAWAHTRAKGLQLLREGDTGGAEKEIERAIDETPTFTGKLNGEEFAALRDYDDVLASVIEVFAGGRYLWMPMSHIRSLKFTEHETAVDNLWRQAKLEDSSGDVADVHVPVLYQASYRQDHEAVKLGRQTDWIEHGEIYSGVGQHVLLAIRGDERFEESILDVNSLEFDAVS